MRRIVTLGLASLAAAAAFAPAAQSQDRPLRFRVTPRSFLDPGNVVVPGSINPGYTGYGQTQSYLLSPPYGQNERFNGGGVLPDPITNGPFVGSQNPFGPIDFGPNIESTGSIR
ncbi:hypothetical protein [Microvirga sp. 17 mud 1-3]|uniref:hypothetical protein n=1 Tax=Microvirga sp. 17 mud 1-3 TaxID=2082949 RepID=UPI000D6B132D|nr:hypothetical protein [Microvirga sp. 17 mud 1-3]AWM88758.1 hypothetical protein C4E04_19880 [Microvirga sp. 17 mud 1-3]